MKTFRNEPVLVKVKKGVCNGCYMNLPPQFFNELLSDRDIKTCPNCARLIYLDEEIRKRLGERGPAMSRERLMETAARFLRRLTEDPILAAISEKVTDMDRREISGLLTFAADTL